MPHLFFGGICVFGLIAIFIAALSEFQRLGSGDSVLSRRQSRWRLISAGLWILILGSFAYATIFMWPEANSPRAEKLQFSKVIAGATMLLLPAVILLVLDVRFTMLAQKLSRRKFEAGLEEIAQQEINKVKNSKRDGANAVENSEEI